MSFYIELELVKERSMPKSIFARIIIGIFQYIFAMLLFTAMAIGCAMLMFLE